MNLINPIFLLYSKELLRELDRSRRNPVPYQEKWFKYLIENGKETAFGKEWGFDSIKTVKDFRAGCR
jgi:hypothetical protein